MHGFRNRLTRAGAGAPLLTALLVTACAGPAEEPAETPPRASSAERTRLVEVATSERQWTGITIAPDGRLFVNFPRWSDDVPVSVAELVDGEVVPWPNQQRNAWTPDGGDPARQFVCVQSVVADRLGTLWVLDPASPRFAGVVEGGAKLVRFDLDTGEPMRVFRYAPPVIRPTSYLNDVRVDLDGDIAYITDSGASALIVTDLDTGESRRLLDDHPSTQAEDVVLTIGGEPWLLPDGSEPRIHADGIALTRDRDHLYYQSLTGRTLYRVPTAALVDAKLTAAELGARVEVVGETGAADGLHFGHAGRLYISALEHDAIRRFDPRTGELETVVQDDRIAWPDTFTLSPDGTVHFTTAQIHRGPDPPEPYRILRIEGTGVSSDRGP